MSNDSAARGASPLRVRCDGYDEFLAIREQDLRPLVAARSSQEEAQQDRAPALLKGEGRGTARGGCATACALGVEQRERDILPSSSIYGISALRAIYIYIYLYRVQREECASGPNNCFWKCEQRALINALTVALGRSVNYSRQ